MRRQQALQDGWHIRQLETETVEIAALVQEARAPSASWLSAQMPAQVHEVLLAHGQISDPHLSRNAAESAWVGEKDWAYACTFAGPDRDEGAVFLRFKGLDTLATVYLNGSVIGQFDNMFREYVIDVKERLTPGQENTLLLVFHSPLRFVQAVHQPPEHAGKIARHKYFRKAANDFGTYLGARPHAVKVGVYRDIILDVTDRAWIEDVWVRTELTPDHSSATLRISVETSGAPVGVEWRLLAPSGQEVSRGITDTAQPGFVIPVDKPELWWPRTHGAPHLYCLEVRLLCDGECVDERSVQVGIRNITPVLEDAQTGEPRFQFLINGQALFLQGANWIPVEGMTHAWRPDRARRLLELAAHAGMNILRVWGGGHVPPQEFYDECDRRGLLVWQDFMFEYGMYPDDDPGFVANCADEVEGIVRRLRSHACVLLWCGGNENYMGWDFQFGGEPAIGRKLFEQMMPDICARLDPTRLFHPSCPYGGRVPNWPLEGDWHDYTTLTFAHQSSVPLFVSEIGRVSGMSPKNMRKFLSEEEYWPRGHDPAIRMPGQAAWPPMWQYRSVDGSWDKVGSVEAFCDPSAPEDLLRILGSAHGEYLQHSIERLRRGVPDGAPTAERRCWGNIIWRLNDAWPILYWSVVDYYLEPKIAYYYLRRAYAPVLLSFERTADRLAVWVVNDSPSAVSGSLRVQRRRFDGTVRGELAVNLEMAPGMSRRCLDTSDLGPISLREEFLHARLNELEATYLLHGERYLHLPRAILSARRAGGEIEVTSQGFARQVVFEAEVTGIRFEDNFFDMAAGQKRTIAVLDHAPAGNVTVRAYNAEPITFTL